MKTLVIEDGDRLTIRACATPTDDPTWDKCETLAFFQQHSVGWPSEMNKLIALLSEIGEKGTPQPHDDTKFKKLVGTEGLYEFKTNGGLRLLCFWDTGPTGKFLVTTHGYVKDGRKAPSRETRRAEQTKAEYFIAKQQGTLTHAQER